MTLPKHWSQVITPCAQTSSLTWKSSQRWTFPFFRHSALQLSLSPPGFSSTRIFSFTCKMWLQLHWVNRLLPPSCLSTCDTADAMSGYCSNSEWQRSIVNEKEKQERWVVWLNYWLISGLIAELIACLVLPCVRVTDRAFGTVVKEICENVNAAWTKRTGKYEQVNCCHLETRSHVCMNHIVIFYD